MRERAPLRTCLHSRPILCRLVHPESEGLGLRIACLLAGGKANIQPVWAKGGGGIRECSLRNLLKEDRTTLLF